MRRLRPTWTGLLYMLEGAPSSRLQHVSMRNATGQPSTRPQPQGASGSPAPCSPLPAPLLVPLFVIVVDAVVIVVFEHPGRPQDVPLDGLGVRRVRRVDRGPTRVFE